MPSPGRTISEASPGRASREGRDPCSKQARAHVSIGPLIIRRDKIFRMSLPWPFSFGGQEYCTSSPFSHQWPGHGPFQRGIHNMSTKWSKRQPCLYPSLALWWRHVPVIPPMRNHCGNQLPVGRDTNLCWYLPIARSCESPGPSGMLCQSSSRGAWLDPRSTANPALTSALCSVTRITPCSLGLGWVDWSTWSKFKPPAQLLVGTGPGNPLCWRRWASCHKSSTSKSVTGTQSLSRSTMWRPGKTKQRAARTKVPAHVGWTKWRPLA